MLSLALARITPSQERATANLVYGRRESGGPPARFSLIRPIDSNSRVDH